VENIEVGSEIRLLRDDEILDFKKYGYNIFRFKMID
jgi:hypothetical protein